MGPKLRHAGIVRRIADALDNPSLRAVALADVQTFAAGGHRFDPDGATADLLTVAAGCGWDDAVGVLLAAGAERGSMDWALAEAACGGHLSIVETLLAHGADVHIGEDRPLHLAAEAGHLPVVDRLLAAGADVHSWMCLALRMAATQRHLPVVERLLSAGADANWALSLCTDEDGELLAACKTLNACAAAIPVAQRQPLIDNYPRRFPALRALHAADQRRSTTKKTSLCRSPSP